MKKFENPEIEITELMTEEIANGGNTSGEDQDEF